MAAGTMGELHQGQGTPWAWLAFLVLAGVAVFSGYLSNGFIYDDEYLILESDYYDRPFQTGDLLRDLGSVLYGQNMGYWRPGQLLLYRAEFALFDTHPKGWHGVALLLHLAAACLFFLFARRLLQDSRLAALVALLFALHPAVSEVVGSNNFQISSAEGVFTFAALIAWIGRRHILAGCCMALALSFRESALVLPLLFFLLLSLEEGNVPRKRLIALAWPVALAVLYVIVRYGVLDITMLKAQETFGLASRMGLIAFMAARAILLPLPSFLSIAHDPRPETGSVAVGWLAIGLCIGCMVWLIVRAKKGKGRLPAVCFGTCLIAAAPYSGILPPYILFAEHYFYLPLAFLLCTLGSLVLPLRRRVPVQAVAVILILFYAAVSYGRAGVFKDNGTAFSHTLKLYPDSITAHMSMGTHYYRLKEYDRAINEYLFVLNQTDGKHEKAWNNLGDIYFRNKRWHDAEKCFRQAGETGERNLAIVLFMKKRYDEAGPLIEKLAERYPGDRTLAEMKVYLEQLESKEDLSAKDQGDEDGPG